MSEAIAEFAGVDGSLRGILVLELCGDEPSGTYGTQILADLGATVIKVERLPQGEPAPTPEPADGKVRADIAYMFGLNRNKRSICLDMKSEAGVALFKDLVAIADVVYDNYKPGVTKKLGVDADTLRAIKPELIVCSVSGFGQTGPWSQLPAYDATIQALGGGMSITGTGEKDSAPVRWGNPIGGIAGALYAVTAVLTALRRRRVQAKGATLDVALLDAQLAMNSYRVPPAMTGTKYEASPHRGGNGAMPYGPFKAGDDRWFVLGITKQFFATCAKVLGHPEWIDDPRFATEEARYANQSALNAEVTNALQAHDSAEWQRRFVEAGIPGAKVTTIPEAFEHPHVAQRDMLVSFDHPIGKHLKVAGNPIKMSAHPYKGFSAAPGLGADTEIVLEKLLKLNPQQRDAIRAQRAAWWPLTGEVFDRPSVV